MIKRSLENGKEKGFIKEGDDNYAYKYRNSPKGLESFSR